MRWKTIATSLLISSLLLFLACSPARDKVDLSGTEIGEVQIKRYGQALFNLDTDPEHLKQGLIGLSADYSFFLGNEFDDTLDLVSIHNFITDPFNRNLADECARTYPGLAGLEEQMELAFRYYKYHLPDQDIPAVYSYVSGLGYELPVYLADSVLIIALDMYLGHGFTLYRQLGLPNYKVKRMEKAYILPDCFREIAVSELVSDRHTANLLDMMIYHGKILYFLDAVLPETDDSLKIGYTARQMEWCRDNESNTWAYLIDRELLYSADYHKINKFIMDGPFTSGQSQESPAMIGRWTGWQIVRHYMKKNSNIPLSEMLANPDSQDILRQSGYKPKK
jgi:uncharacterized protein YjaZ